MLTVAQQKLADNLQLHLKNKVLLTEELLGSQTVQAVVIVVIFILVLILAGIGKLVKMY